MKEWKNVDDERKKENKKRRHCGKKRSEIGKLNEMRQSWKDANHSGRNQF